MKIAFASPSKNSARKEKDGGGGGKKRIAIAKLFVFHANVEKKTLAIAKRCALHANAKKCKSNSKKTVAFSISPCFFKWHMTRNIRFQWKGFLLKVTKYFKYFVTFNQRNKWRTKIFSRRILSLKDDFLQ